ncbi:hypothetical protein Nepgr_008578 [Nepenthes gracilis]|uniref:F-box protein n=1 Tax=Nepenthes gracilis TaxID=150966 RepID=A0AAD3S8Y8_NEPGR|nr:hypothetical protein Nepgr_008578 [Nepenthes gracilis]
MDSLPDAIIHFILSHLTNAKDVACCICVSKRWKHLMPSIKSLYFPRNIFDNLSNTENPDTIIWKMVSLIDQLEELVVYCPFTSSGLVSWISVASSSLRHLELRVDNLNEHLHFLENPMQKLECIDSVRNLETLKLWGVLMDHSPKWDVFQNLRTLEIVGAKVEDSALSGVFCSCPNLTHLMLLGCQGLASVSIELRCLEVCRLDLYGPGSCLLFLSCPKLTTLEVTGCGWIRVRETQCLRNLSIGNNAGRVYMVDFGKLGALESLYMKGVQWCWGAITNMLQWASEVKHLFMKVEFTGDSDNLLPFPEIDFVEFFNSHPNLRKLDIHGAMFAALCQKNGLRNVDSGFSIPILEEVAITVRSPLNAEQKMSTLESLLKYSGNLKKMVIRILQMKSGHSSADDFFDEVWKFSRMNQRIVHIE